ncbi:MAG: hypothetical protein Q7S56_04040 [Nanoarchaeota archaeon]|nr:hypothetical protein [Nanoarchaeota archaeon]
MVGFRILRGEDFAGEHSIPCNETLADYETNVRDNPHHTILTQPRRERRYSAELNREAEEFREKLLYSFIF